MWITVLFAVMEGADVNKAVCCVAQVVCVATRRRHMVVALIWRCTFLWRAAVRFRANLLFRLVVLVGWWVAFVSH
jgi:hypothetical protein